MRAPPSRVLTPCRAPALCAACASCGEQDLEQSALAPAWVKVLCPNAKSLDLCWDTLAPLHQPQPPRQVESLRWERAWAADQDPPMAEHVRQQLAALPSLTWLTVGSLSWSTEAEEDEPQARRLISSSLTKLEVTSAHDTDRSRRLLQRLPTQFPNLKEVSLMEQRNQLGDPIDDDGLEALLSLPHLERLRVWGLQLRRSHAHRAWPLKRLEVNDLDVDSFARLPLGSIPACGGRREVLPSADAAAVARVAQAVQRWGTLCDGHGLDRWRVNCQDFAALLVTLRPLLAALPVAERCDGTLLRLRDVTPQQVQQLGQQLPPGVTSLHIYMYELSVDAWAALLPSLPAEVTELDFGTAVPELTEEHVLALCRAAVRPVRVEIKFGRSEPFFAQLTEQDLERIRGALAGPDGQPGLVTLVGRFFE